MFRFICLELIRNASRAPTNYNFCYLQIRTLKSSSNSVNQPSLTISYLINSCGFSLESAISASEKINIRCTKKSDSVLELFRTYEFTETQIKNIVAKRPKLLLAKPRKTLKPKIELLKSLGISTPELAEIVYKEPLLLTGCLKTLIISFNFLRRFVHSDKNLVKIISRSYHYLLSNLEKAMGPSISILRTHGVSEHNISRLIMLQPSTLILNTDRFRMNVGKVKKWGFDPTSFGFLLAVRTLMAVRESIREQKLEAYRSFGWSEEEILSAFKLQPMCMLPSEQKIRKLMDFFVNKLEWKPSVISKHPSLMLLSLEKRIIPRCSVLWLLMSRGLVEKNTIVPAVFRSTERRFLAMFVTKYQSLVPDVVKAYQVLKNIKLNTTLGADVLVSVSPALVERDVIWGYIMMRSLDPLLS